MDEDIKDFIQVRNQDKSKIDEAWTIQDKSDKFTTSPHPDFSQYRSNDWNLVDTYFKSPENDEFRKHIDFDNYCIFNDSCNAFIDGTPANKALQGVDALFKEASDLQNPNFMSMSLSDLSSSCGSIESLYTSITNKLSIMGDTLNAYKAFLENPYLLDEEKNALSSYYNKLDNDSLKLEDTKNALSTYRDNINDREETLSIIENKIMDLQL
ncbi:MAG: hypothetical protein K6E76_04890 [Patescibacteria group bacterium]|nr:hypothetical protein [Patescibacteria group bacterium]